VGYRLVERPNPSVRAGLHHSAFHSGQHKDSQAVNVAPGRKAFTRLFQETADGSGPRRKVGGDALVRWHVLSLDFESQAPDGTSVPVSRRQKTLPVTLKDAEDALQRVCECRFSRLDDHWIQPLLVTIQQSQQQGFLTIEEVIKAAAVRMRPVEQFRHTRGSKALFPEQMAGGFEQPIPRGYCLPFHLNDRSSRARTVASGQEERWGRRFRPPSLSASLPRVRLHYQRLRVTLPAHCQLHRVCTRRHPRAFAARRVHIDRRNRTAAAPSAS
jgi:hypothetical protein